MLFAFLSVLNCGKIESENTVAYIKPKDIRECLIRKIKEIHCTKLI